MNIDASFWVSVCFFIFFALVYKPFKNILFKFLDERSFAIKEELEAVNIIKYEASENLKEYKKKQVKVEKEIEEIYQNTDLAIKNMKDKAEKDINEYFNRKKLQIEEKILSHKSEVIASLKHEAVIMVADITRYLILKNINQNINDNLIKSSLDNISNNIKENFS